MLILMDGSDRRTGLDDVDEVDDADDMADGKRGAETAHAGAGPVTVHPPARVHVRAGTRVARIALTNVDTGDVW
ncbi:hypothetical protein SAMN05421678_105191 [Actinopolymorpha cephalotaxi]|uniref:Uncharacterized protein n=1 Tax=Actinopolymorpha cephalotaxi TaxID=504797 RepID=A0A1I2R152_9ACTN|nr:hypothetical protein [Actinopolymorpha cephalotaxi]SFG34040.1 hypothetical protein SAMN05421678_105191 [Actinopolymorpha cephalotaxi]